MARDGRRASEREGSGEGEGQYTDHGDELVTYYTVLQVTESASATDSASRQRSVLIYPVRKAYLRLALQWHPDRAVDPGALAFRTIKGSPRLNPEH